MLGYSLSFFFHTLFSFILRLCRMHSTVCLPVRMHFFQRAVIYICFEQTFEFGAIWTGVGSCCVCVCQIVIKLTFNVMPLRDVVRMNIIIIIITIIIVGGDDHVCDVRVVRHATNQKRKKITKIMLTRVIESTINEFPSKSKTKQNKKRDALNIFIVPRNIKCCVAELTFAEQQQKIEILFSEWKIFCDEYTNLIWWRLSPGPICANERRTY